jgi:O-antigen ligase
MRLLLILITLFLPIGTRKIFGNIGVVRHEWNAIFISFTDILLFLLLALLLLQKRFKEIFNRRLFFLFLFIGTIAISIFINGLDPVSIFRFVKLVLFVSWGMALGLIFKNKEGNIFFIIFLISALLQSFISGAQFFKQEDLGLRILGESPLDVQASGVAKIDIFGAKLVRSYGTFPHPNVLAAYTIVAIFISCIVSSLYKKEWILIFNIPFLFSLFSSFSRSGLFALFFGIVVFLCFVSKSKNNISEEDRKILVSFFTILFIFFVMFGAVLFDIYKERVKFNLTEKALIERIYYNNIAIKMIKENILFGVGWGRFSDKILDFVEPKPIAVPSFSFPLWFLQPVHNIYLLIGAEAGILALILFIIFLVGILWNSFLFGKDIKSAGIFASFCSLLFMGLFDHFLITIQQGTLLFWFVIGILIGQNICARSLMDKALASGAKDYRFESCRAQ